MPFFEASRRCARPPRCESRATIRSHRNEQDEDIDMWAISQLGWSDSTTIDEFWGGLASRAPYRDERSQSPHWSVAFPITRSALLLRPAADPEQELDLGLFPPVTWPLVREREAAGLPMRSLGHPSAFNRFCRHVAKAGAFFLAWRSVGFERSRLAPARARDGGC